MAVPSNDYSCGRTVSKWSWIFFGEIYRKTYVLLIRAQAAVCWGGTEVRLGRSLNHDWHLAARTMQLTVNNRSGSIQPDERIKRICNCQANTCPSESGGLIKIITRFAARRYTGRNAHAHMKPSTHILVNMWTRMCTCAHASSCKCAMCTT